MKKDTTKSKTVTFNFDEDKVIKIISYLILAKETCLENAVDLGGGHEEAQGWLDDADEVDAIIDELNDVLPS